MEVVHNEATINIKYMSCERTCKWKLWWDLATNYNV